jgi:hypothetical protein
MNVSRQIGWSQESNLLYQILKQLNKLTSIMFGLKPKYKVYTALLTQSGGDVIESIQSSPLVIGTTYTISDYIPNDDFTNVGAPSNQTGVSFVATGTTPNNWNESSELTYNTGAPVVTVLENTIGNIWFTFISDGVYGINSNGLFTSNKTYLSNLGFIGDDTSFTFFSVYNNPNLIIIGNSDSGNPSNNLLNNHPIESRVYN